ncbi:D-alanyl-D-alanine carboxypeptidase [Streptomyces sp. Go-475]|uniref:D-alanyl-D-alanine carboxypeptidase n=1 Tax=Streptomyces sp. Go-475 TaxID=2072505 RepID=UPI000DF03028|nr:D-alanyl-D-alanine carboxypeptidase [Streptomyces sp. Go-475]AXE86619.1 D-alanyl-D-alanine endopeptidase precursor [Streptomyces sp. Go-475]
MAGESPDRSKQRESSAEPTSGSAGPVPGARSETADTREPRDPRLAVARDAERSSGRGGVDTATRVLSTRPSDDTATPPADAGQDESDSDSEGAAADAGQEAVKGAGEPSGAGSGSGEPGDGATAGDGRLRDAVAAWVASADEGKEPAGGAERPTKAATDAQEAGKPTGAPEADRDAGDGREAERADETTDVDTDAQDGQEAAEGAGEVADPRDSREGESKGGQEAAGAASEKAEEGPGGVGAAEADRSGSAGGAGAAQADSGSEEGPAASAAEPKTEPKADSRAGSKTERENAGKAEPKADADTKPDADPEADPKTQPKTDSRAGSKTERETAGKAEPKADADTKPDAEPKADPKTQPKAGSEAGADAGAAVASGDGDKGAEDDVEPDAEDAREEPEPADKPGGGEKAASGSKPSDEKAASDDTGDTEADAGDTGGTDDDRRGRPVDQPTAVFKAVRPPVDQPTTMLKLGGAAKDVPEREAERTSKFVALKPLDDPSTRRPAGSAPAPQGSQAPAAPQAAPADATAPVPTVGPERTTQQPLPPKPPLDLLAELTNTPPPPDTPLRTAVRRVKIWTPLVLLLVVVFAVVQSVRPLPAPTLDLTAKDSYTFKGGNVDIPWPAKGQAALDVQGIGTFGSSGEQKPVPIASVAKVMTAYVILRDHPLKSGAEGPKIEIDQAAEDQSDAGQESTVDVTKGDKISEREALESILIASANNVARLLARWDAGSEKAFVQKMNDAAKDLGMKNTTYTDPSGLNNTTVSTAVDQVKLAKAAMQQPAFREVAAMMSYVDYKGTKHDNWNRLVGSNDVTGIKTGTTTSALGNLVFAAKKDVNGETRRIIGAVVRQPAGGPDNTILGAALYEGDKLIRAAQGALESATILKKGTVVGYADDGLGGRTPVAVTEDVTAVGWSGLSVKLTFAADDLPHTAKAGTKVGTLTVGDGTTSAVKVPVALQEDLVEPGFGAKLTRLG